MGEMVDCPNCNGRGQFPGGRTCALCGGSGQVRGEKMDRGTDRLRKAVKPPKGKGKKR